MTIDRRRFLTALPALGSLASARPAAQSAGASDPLGVRNDFPAAAEQLYLDSAYIAPTPRPVVEAGRMFAERKGRQPISLGDMLARTDQVRAAARWRRHRGNRVPLRHQRRREHRHQNGFRHEMPPLAELPHRRGAWLYADAIQAVGMFPIDVKAAGVGPLRSTPLRRCRAGEAGEEIIPWPHAESRLSPARAETRGPVSSR